MAPHEENGVCRCCLTVALCRSMFMPVLINGLKEIYSEMLDNCLALKIPHNDSTLGLYLICGICIDKLKYCYDFKQQVLDAMRAFDSVIKLENTNEDVEDDLDVTDNICEFKSESHTDDSVFVSNRLPDIRNGANNAIVTPRRKYKKKKPSGAQRAREILEMMDQEKLQCKICTKIFPNNYGLKVHMHVHFPDYKCDICGKGFAIKKQCQYHKRRHQLGDFVCAQCGELLPSRAKYDHHMFSHRKKYSYVCRYCNERFKSHYAREKHLRDAHESEKKYKCTQCSEMFLVKGTLDIHYKRIHAERENKYICDLCDKSFFDRTALKKHMIVHNGERIHQCKVCFKSYPRIRTLHEHMKIHNNVRDYMCSVCGKSFVQACTLRGHLKVHEKEKMRESDTKPVEIERVF